MGGITHSILACSLPQLPENVLESHIAGRLSVTKSRCIQIDCQYSVGGSRSLHHSYYQFERADVACTSIPIEANSPKKSLGMERAI